MSNTIVFANPETSSVYLDMARSYQQSKGLPLFSSSKEVFTSKTPLTKDNIGKLDEWVKFLLPTKDISTWIAYANGWVSMKKKNKLLSVFNDLFITKKVIDISFDEWVYFNEELVYARVLPVLLGIDTIELDLYFDGKKFLSDEIPEGKIRNGQLCESILHESLHTGFNKGYHRITFRKVK